MLSLCRTENFRSVTTNSKLNLLTYFHFSQTPNLVIITCLQKASVCLDPSQPQRWHKLIRDPQTLIKLNPAHSKHTRAQDADLQLIIVTIILILINTLTCQHEGFDPEEAHWLLMVQAAFQHKLQLFTSVKLKIIKAAVFRRHTFT